MAKFLWQWIMISCIPFCFKIKLNLDSNMGGGRVIFSFRYFFVIISIIFWAKLYQSYRPFPASIFYEVYTYTILRGKWIIFRDTYQANVKLIKNMPFKICHECKVCDIGRYVTDSMLSSLLKMRLKMSPALTVHSTHSSMKCQVRLYFFSVYSQSAPRSPTRYPRND